MKLLTRYVIREHIGPLIFSLSALTSLLMLQYVARQLANLAGKGLPWSAIGQFFVLSLPFTIAMTMPMAVLVATLHAFGRMAADREITAFKASGVRVRTLMLPVLWCAFLLSLGMVWFNDQVLAASNHRLRVLQSDIARTRPTLALREQALNPITDQFFIRVSRVNAGTNRMYDVVIYDLTGGPNRKTIYADSGVISPAVNNRDLQFTLFDGFAQEFSRGDPRRLQRSFFQEQIIRMANIAQGFETSTRDEYKGDREMTVCELHRRYVFDAVDVERARQEYISNAIVLQQMGAPAIREPRQRPRADALGRFYCEKFVPALTRVFLPRRADAQEGQPPAMPGTQPAPAPEPQQVPPGEEQQAVAADSGTPLQPAPGLTWQQDSLLRASGIDPNMRPATADADPVDSLQVYRGALAASGSQLVLLREGLDSVAVEIHKKFALSFACLVFVLFGPPVALRFPRGGVGVTIGVGILVFGLYYVCLMGGETLADKGRLPAFVAMWLANVIFTLLGLILLWRVESATDQSRGGGIREWWSDRRSRRAARKTSRRTRGLVATT